MFNLEETQLAGKLCTSNCKTRSVNDQLNEEPNWHYMQLLFRKIHSYMGSS